VDLRASPSKDVLSSKLSTARANPEWDFVAKGDKWAPMLESFIFSSPSLGGGGGRGGGGGGSASVEKNKGIGFTELVGAVVGGVGRSMLL
jgi:hypothetical protein